MFVAYQAEIFVKSFLVEQSDGKPAAKNERETDFDHR